MQLQLDLVLLHSCNLSYLQSVLTHSFLSGSGKLGHELSISNKLPVSPAPPPACISLDPYPIFNLSISTMLPLLRDRIFYWAYFWTPKVLSRTAEMTVPFDANSVTWLRLLAYCTYSSVRDASKGIFDIPWLALMIHFFLKGLYTAYLRPGSARQGLISNKTMAVF